MNAILTAEKKVATVTDRRRDKVDPEFISDIFCLAGNRFFMLNQTPRGRMSDVPLQKNKHGISSTDVLNYLREEKC
ncbi:hypothetical protein AGMMS49982_05790 [Bacteroidia bacterium]|nr:hypothetical protein AGMMS49982_05790 [Bacteroidia bacterium]